MAKPVLYSYFRSSASWRVRTVLALKGIDYDYKAVNLLKEGNRDADYMGKINPLGQVPALMIDGTILTQSIPIMEYLEETRPGGYSILPKDHTQRAKARMIAEMVNAGIQPIQNLPVMAKIAEWTSDNSKKVEWSKHWIEEGFKGIEQTLKETSGKYCVGDEVTMADICLVPQVFNASMRFNVDMNNYPNMKRVHEECMRHPAFQAAQPTNQPDCPENMK